MIYAMPKYTFYFTQLKKFTSVQHEAAISLKRIRGLKKDKKKEIYNDCDYRDSHRKYFEKEMYSFG